MADDFEEDDDLEIEAELPQVPQDQPGFEPRELDALQRVQEDLQDIGDAPPEAVAMPDLPAAAEQPDAELDPLDVPEIGELPNLEEVVAPDLSDLEEGVIQPLLDEIPDAPAVPGAPPLNAFQKRQQRRLAAENGGVAPAARPRGEAQQQLPAPVAPDIEEVAAVAEQLGAIDDQGNLHVGPKPVKKDPKGDVNQGNPEQNELRDAVQQAGEGNIEVIRLLIEHNRNMVMAWAELRAEVLELKNAMQKRRG